MMTVCEKLGRLDEARTAARWLIENVPDEPSGALAQRTLDRIGES